jgi:ATP-binding cassette subfamily B protein
MRDLTALSWPNSRVGEALAVLARHAGFESEATSVPSPENESALESWIECGAKKLDCEAHLLEIPFRDLQGELAAAYPALLRLPSGSFLLLVAGSRRGLRVLTPALGIERISIHDLVSAIREPLDRSPRAQFEEVLQEAGIPRSRQARTLRLLMDDQSGSRPFRGCWILRPAPGASTFRSLREANSLQHGAALMAAHLAQYLVWLASWAILGSLSLSGHLDRGWLAAWALLLVTFIPFQLLATRLQGSFAIGLGGWLKRRLLTGALRLKPEQMRHSGIGGYLGQALEATSLESLAISGGIAGLLAAIELILAMFLLGRFAVVLLAWCALTWLVAYRFTRRFERWTNMRMEITEDLVESMVGHRTGTPARIWRSTVISKSRGVSIILALGWWLRFHGHGCWRAWPVLRRRFSRHRLRVLRPLFCSAAFFWLIRRFENCRVRLPISPLPRWHGSGFGRC